MQRGLLHGSFGMKSMDFQDKKPPTLRNSLYNDRQKGGEIDER